MSQKILIANRGEIARRVIRSCRRLGLSTVAVYSDADAGLRFVSEADEAIRIGEASPRASYLNQAAILAAVEQTGATAVHPGYGFLAENADFADAVSSVGAIWVGPAPDTIRDMGDKQRARDIATSAGVPVVPGSQRFAEGDLDGLSDAGTAVGFPLLVKASAGGGGIGMQKVETPENLVATAQATQSMAAKAFGDGSIFLERFIPKARHVEIQVFGYGDGSGIHLFERDCSLQRRYQKVVEESPAPGLSPQTRDAMTAAAVSLVRHTSYAGAGTVEFIVDAASEEFFFLEMNTRIQVEHPVTEMVTGTDLVGMQLELALGTIAPVAQAQITLQGAAIECRLYAENPKMRFFPSPGVLERFVLPGEDETLRIDNTYVEGDEVTPNYDPMIAKIIASGPTRHAAIERVHAALTETTVEGLQTNLEFLLEALAHPAFVAGDVHTGFIDMHADALIPSKKG